MTTACSRRDLVISGLITDDLCAALSSLAAEAGLEMDELIEILEMRSAALPASMDEARGRALLEEGGHVDILAPNLTNLDRIAIALASQLEEAGLDVSITILDWASFIARRSDWEAWDIYISATSRVALPLEKAYLFASSPGGFDDAGCSELLDELAASPDIETAAAIWQEAQIELWKYVPVIVPGHYSTVHASSSDLQGIDFSDGFHFRTAFFK